MSLLLLFNRAPVASGTVNCSAAVTCGPATCSATCDFVAPAVAHGRWPAPWIPQSVPKKPLRRKPAVYECALSAALALCGDLKDAYRRPAVYAQAISGLLEASGRLAASVEYDAPLSGTLAASARFKVQSVSIAAVRVREEAWLEGYLVGATQ